jgi:hypothetical protein
MELFTVTAMAADVIAFICESISTTASVKSKIALLQQYAFFFKLDSPLQKLTYAG